MEVRTRESGFPLRGVERTWGRLIGPTWGIQTEYVRKSVRTEHISGVDQEGEDTEGKGTEIGLEIPTTPESQRKK